MKSLADHVHSLGLKFGLSSSNGTGTCQNVAGQLAHETMDAQDYASWGVDYLKRRSPFAAGRFIRSRRARIALAG